MQRLSSASSAEHAAAGTLLAMRASRSATLARIFSSVSSSSPALPFFALAADGLALAPLIAFFFVCMSSAAMYASSSR